RLATVVSQGCCLGANPDLIGHFTQLDDGEEERDTEGLDGYIEEGSGRRPAITEQTVVSPIYQPTALLSRFPAPSATQAPLPTKPIHAASLSLSLYIYIYIYMCVCV
ncbi:hypothetical protein KIPB_015186, partial [Kipferlia bialata]